MQPSNTVHRPLQILAVFAVALLLLAPLAHAKKRRGDRDRSDRHQRTERHDRDDHGDHAHHGKGGIPAVLKKLDEMQDQLVANAAEIAHLREQVQALDASVTPCTLERFRNGECGPDNHPLDLLVSVCGGLGADAGLALKYAFQSKLGAQIGVGWKDGPDIDIKEGADLPAILLVGGVVPVVLPSELAGQASASAGLGLDGCLAPIRIPVGKQLAEPVVIAILEELEAQAAPIADTLVAQLGGGSGAAMTAASANGAPLGLAGLADALAAAEALRDQEIIDDDPIAAFGRGPLGDLAASLPVGNRATILVADPSQLALPTLRGNAGGGANALAASLALDAVIGNVCGGPLAASFGPVCDFIETRIPGTDRVLALVPIIETVPDIVGNVVDGVRSLLEPLFTDVGESTSNTLQRFCNSSVGQRRIFDALCGR